MIKNNSLSITADQTQRISEEDKINTLKLSLPADSLEIKKITYISDGKNRDDARVVEFGVVKRNTELKIIVMKGKVREIRKALMDNKNERSVTTK